jgi:translation initiation factor 2 beta subunit (eIF-2beta)/eIF-5
MSARRNINVLSAALMTVATLTVLSVSVHAASGEVSALRRADTFFGANGGFWSTWVVDPLTRRQAVRKLDRLSKSLYDLATEKQELAEALSANNGSVDRQKAETTIRNFKDIVKQVRHDLEEFSSILPEDQREEGMNVARELFEGLSQKWETLNRAERLVGERGANSQEVVNELRAAVKQVQELKSKVDKLIERIKTH